MRVTVCGLGRVGGSIAKRLVKENCDVTVIDQDPDLVSEFSLGSDVRGVVGSATDPDVLSRAKVDVSDVVIATTGVDEVNIATAQLTHTLFDVPTKIARLRGDHYHEQGSQALFGDDQIPIDVAISPERLVAEEAWRRLSYPSAVAAQYVARDKAVVLGVRIDPSCVLTDLPISQIDRYYDDVRAMFLLIERDGVAFIPTGKTSLQVGDIAYAAVQAVDSDQFMALFGVSKQRPSRVLLAGGGRTGRYVARRLIEESNLQWLRIIDRNANNAHRVAAEFDDALVLHGNILDRTLLLEAGADDAEAILSLTNDNRDNLIAGLMAKEMGCAAAIALVYDPDFVSLATSMGLDGYIDPSNVTHSKVLAQIRRGRVIGVQTIGGGSAEIVEVVALPSAPLLGRPLAQIEELEGIRIGAVLRGDELLIPNGRTEIQPYDHVVMSYLDGYMGRVEQMMRVGLGYFA